MNQCVNQTKLSVCMLLAMFLASCMPSPTQENVNRMKSVDKKSLPLLAKRVRQESEKLAAAQAEMRRLNHPKAHPMIIEPPMPTVDPMEAHNVNVDVHNADVQMVLRAIAKQAGMNLIMSPLLSVSKRTISLHLKNVSARVVFDQMMRQLDLNGEVRGNVLIVSPFQERIYHLDFLQTTLAANFNAGGDVFGANNTGGGGSSGSGSGGGVLRGDFSLKGSSGKAGDAYKQIDRMLMKLIGKPGSKATNPAPASAKKNRTAASVYALNRMSGTLYVRARPSQVRAVTRLINQYKEVLKRQVLIEARIIDVSLNDSHQYGVDWSVLRKRVAASYAGGGGQQIGGISGLIPGPSSPPRTVTIPASVSGALGKALGIAYATTGFDVAINLLRQFGVVRVLSNPTILAKNARPALINVGTNTRFVSQSSVTTNNVGGSTTTTADVQTDSVFSGVMLGVVPFIGEDNRISLTIHPIETEVNKDSLRLQDVGGGNKVTLPVVDFKGMTTTLELSDGETVMLGGLIDEVGADGGDGVPWISRVPGLGNLFGSRNHSVKTRELVIILSVHRI